MLPRACPAPCRTLLSVCPNRQRQVAHALAAFQFGAGAQDGVVVDPTVAAKGDLATLVHLRQHVEQFAGGREIAVQTGLIEDVFHGIVEATAMGLVDAFQPVGGQARLGETGETIDDGGELAQGVDPKLAVVGRSPS